ncbi:MAG: hypothetical protein HPY59_00070 [Anaerolineae bacterium]|nr:hypothetical protein [Anaerolineae bacterium]
MSWQDGLKGDSLSWLLEHESPDVRYQALRHLADLPPGEPALTEAARLARTIEIIREKQGDQGAGRWNTIIPVKPGAIMERRDNPTPGLRCAPCACSKPLPERLPCWRI